MRAEIADKGYGHGSVHLDGEDVSKGVVSYTLTGGVNRIPQLALSVAVHENVHFAGDVEITIPEAVRKILLHMGWTPPTPQPPDGTGVGAAGSAPPG